MKFKTIMKHGHTKGTIGQGEKRNLMMYLFQDYGDYLGYKDLFIPSL